MSPPTEEDLPEATESTPEGPELTAEETGLAPEAAELTPSASAAPTAPASASRLDQPRVREAVSRQSRGYTLRLEPSDLARLRELPGARGRSDEELGEEFLAGQCDRFVTALSDDVAAPATIRVVVDPWSRQAFLALEKTIRAIVSF